MNLPAIRIEHPNCGGVRRPIHVDHKRDGVRDASCVGAPFPKDAGRTIEKLDSVLHAHTLRLCLGEVDRH
jgi:hypothetical protein